jgi:hypothetical protein
MSNTTLAQKSRVSRKAANCAIRSLEEQGRLVRLGVMKYGTVRYRWVRYNPAPVTTGYSHLSPQVTHPVTTGYTNVIERKDNDKDKRKSELCPDPLSPELLEAKELCEYLIQRLGVENQTVTKTWMVSMERLVRIDGRSADQIRRCLDWVAADDFWSVNVRSPQKLRKHWERLRLEAKRKINGVSGKSAKRKGVLEALAEMGES